MFLFPEYRNILVNFIQIFPMLHIFQIVQIIIRYIIINLIFEIIKIF